MTFQDIFKSSFLEKTTSFSVLDMLIALAIALLIGLFIFVVYKKTFRGVLYSSGFGVSLVAMSLITTFIILAVTSNVVLSLGMVGALSIVRFRAAIKEPLDIAYLFWSISVGIVLGAGLIPLALFGSALIGVVLIFFSNRRSPERQPYLLVVNCNNTESEKAVLNELDTSVGKYLLKSKTVSANHVEFTLELRLKDSSTNFVSGIASLPRVESAVLVSYNGEYQS